jgi:putative spermidine/putrescine transport system permease protein
LALARAIVFEPRFVLMDEPLSALDEQLRERIRFALVSSALPSFLASFDEVILALFIAGGPNSTLTRNMFAALRDQIDPPIAAVSTLMIAVTSLALALAQVFGQRKA